MKTVRIFLLLTILIAIIDSQAAEAQNLEKNLTEDLIGIGGSMGVNAGTYNVTGIDPRDRDFRYSLVGSVNVRLWEINFPFSMVVSEQQFDYTQPSNQYGFSPYYKWITLHGGWRSLTYSPFTLAGHTFLGGGFDLTPGNFRISAMYGRFNKATSGDSSLMYSVPTYERTGYAAKLGYGSQANYVDLIFLKAKDDESSLDTSFQKIVKPEENMVLGLSARVNVFTSIFFEMDASSSFYTNDTRAGSMADSTSPVLLPAIKSIYPYNMSSQLTTAFQTSLGWRNSDFGIKLAYKRIDPDYKSMGAYYFESDVENILIIPNVNLFERSLRLSGSFGLQHDNLLNTKLQQSERMIYSAGISFNKPEYGVDLKYSSYGITQYKGLNPLIDSMKVARVNYSFNGSARVMFTTESLLNSIILIGGYQTLVDLNSRTASTSQSDNYMANVAYQGNIASSGLYFGVNLNYVQSIATGSKMEFVGPTAQIGKTISDLNLSGSVSYQFQTINNESSGGTASLNLQAGYSLGVHQSLNLNVNIINSGNGSAAAPAFTEYRTNLGYMYNF